MGTISVVRKVRTESWGYFFVHIMSGAQLVCCPYNSVTRMCEPVRCTCKSCIIYFACYKCSKLPVDFMRMTSHKTAVLGSFEIFMDTHFMLVLSTNLKGENCPLIWLFCVRSVKCGMRSNSYIST